MASGIGRACACLCVKKLLRHDVFGLARLTMNGAFEELSSSSVETTAADLACVGRWARMSLLYANVLHRGARARASAPLFPSFILVHIYFA